MSVMVRYELISSMETWTNGRSFPLLLRGCQLLLSGQSCWRKTGWLNNSQAAGANKLLLSTILWRSWLQGRRKLRRVICLAARKKAWAKATRKESAGKSFWEEAGAEVEIHQPSQPVLAPQSGLMAVTLLVYPNLLLPNKGAKLAFHTVWLPFVTLSMCIVSRRHNMLRRDVRSIQNHRIMV